MESCSCCLVSGVKHVPSSLHILYIFIYVLCGLIKRANYGNVMFYLSGMDK